MTALRIIRSDPDHAAIMAEYFAHNEAHLAPSPKVRGITTQLIAGDEAQDEREFARGESVHFIGTDTELTMSWKLFFEQYRQRCFQACHLGYSVAARYQGQDI